MPSIQEYYEEEDSKQLAWYVIIGGAYLPAVQSIEYQFNIGSVPTATIVVNRDQLPGAVKEEASVLIWLGFRKQPLIETVQLVYGGAKVDSVSRDGPDVRIECVMDGAAKLNYTYNRHIVYDFVDVEAQDAVTALLDLSGVYNYYVELPPWVIGTVVPRAAGTPDEIQFSTYGEAINKVAEVDASPWYAMPTGQIRVEIRDQIPADTARRTYFSSLLVGTVEVSPVGITNPNARPRILSANVQYDRASVSNWIEVDGAVVTELGPNGEQNSHQIIANDDAAPGNFANGAPWIPTPPLFQQFTLSNEFIDTDAKAASVVSRYLVLKNRLLQELAVTVPVDPDVFLGETVAIKDPKFTGVDGLYFLRGYRTQIQSSGATTSLDLVGGPYAGTAGHISPFAEFIWKYQLLHQIVGGAQISAIDLGAGCDLGAKVCEDIPEGTGNEDMGGGLGSGEDKPMTVITFDATPSADFDGQLVSYEWADDQTPQHVGIGPYFTVAYDPAVVSDIEMTLTVTDNDGRTNSLTKRVYVGADHVNLPEGATQDPPMCDTAFGGGTGLGDCCVDGDCSSPPAPGGGSSGEPPGGGSTPGPGGGAGFCNGIGMGYYIAAGPYAMFSLDNKNWQEVLNSDVGVSGNFTHVTSIIDWSTSQSIGIYGTDQGEIFRATNQLSLGTVVAHLDGAVVSLRLDTASGGGTGGTSSTSSLPRYTQLSPGTLTTVQAFQVCLSVGFAIAPAKIAVAIMTAESGLFSAAFNTNPGPPVSHDRGIVQFNDVYHPEVSDACAYDTLCAIQNMFRVSGGGTNFSQWSTYTQGTYKQHLASIDSMVDGITRPPGSTAKFWAATSTGSIYTSEDGGLTWKLQFKGNGYPVNGIATPAGGSTWMYGGDSGNPDTLVQIAPDKTQPNVSSLNIGGALRTALATAGPGYTVSAAAAGSSGLILAFSGGVSPPVWLNSNPLGHPDGWVPLTGLTVSGITTAAPGSGTTFVVAGGGTVFTYNSTTFVEGSTPSPIHSIIWTGLAGQYLAVSDAGLLFSMDAGATWGFLRPNATLGTPALPGGATPEDFSWAIGPRSCTPPPSDAPVTICENFEPDLSNWTFSDLEGGTHEQSTEHSFSPPSSLKLSTPGPQNPASEVLCDRIYNVSEFGPLIGIHLQVFLGAEGGWDTSIEVNNSTSSFSLYLGPSPSMTYEILDYTGSPTAIDTGISIGQVGLWNEILLVINRETGNYVSLSRTNAIDGVSSIDLSSYIGSEGAIYPGPNEMALRLRAFGSITDPGYATYFDDVCITDDPESEGGGEGIGISVTVYAGPGTFYAEPGSYVFIHGDSTVTGSGVSLSVVASDSGTTQMPYLGISISHDDVWRVGVVTSNPFTLSGGVGQWVLLRSSGTIAQIGLDTVVLAVDASVQYPAGGPSDGPWYFSGDLELSFNLLPDFSTDVVVGLHGGGFGNMNAISQAGASFTSVDDGDDWYYNEWSYVYSVGLATVNPTFVASAILGDPYNRFIHEVTSEISITAVKFRAT